MELILNIYDKKGKKVVRQAKGNTVDIMMGTIERLMSLLDIENSTDSIEILKKVSGAYQELKGILSLIFEDVTEEEWNYVKVKELIPVILNVVKYTFAEMNSIPTDPNQKGA